MKATPMSQTSFAAAATMVQGRLPSTVNPVLTTDLMEKTVGSEMQPTPKSDSFRTSASYTQKLARGPGERAFYLLLFIKKYGILQVLLK
jgi:hypothetical protein